MKKFLALALLGGAGYLLYKKYKTPGEAEKPAETPAVASSSQMDLLSRKMAEARAKRAEAEAAKEKMLQAQVPSKTPIMYADPTAPRQNQALKTEILKRQAMYGLSEVQEEGLSERRAAMVMTVRDLKPGGQVTIWHNLVNEQYSPIVPSVRAVEANHIKPIMVTERYVQFRNWGDRVESGVFSVIGRVEYEPRSNLESLGEVVVL